MGNKTITSESLLKSIERHNEKDYRIDFDKLIIKGKLVFDSSLSVKHELIFYSCKLEDVEFINTDINHYIKFQDCALNSIDIKSSKFLKSFEISDCQITKSLCCEESILDELSIFRSKFKNGGIRLDKVECGYFDCKLVVVSDGIAYRDCNFKSDIRFAYINNFGPYYLTNSTIAGKLRITGGILKSHMTFWNGIYKEGCMIERVNFESYLSFKNVTFEKEIGISYTYDANGENNSTSIKKPSPPKEIKIGNSTFNGGFRYDGYENNNGKSVKRTVVNCSKALSGELIFSHLKVDEILITGTNNNAQITLYKIETGLLYLKDFANYSTLQLHKINPLNKDSTIIFYNSILGATNLFSINFKKFHRLIIENSQVVDIVPTNIIWPKQIYVSQRLKSKGNYRELRENYRQLKQAMKKQGDAVQALRFESKEWGAHMNYLKSNYPGLRNHFGDKFILWTNASNDYGLNWVKPLMLLLLSTFVFLIIIVFCIDSEASFSYSYADGDFRRFFKRISSHFWLYFHFLNPAHSLKHFLPELQTNFWGMFWNVLMRLFSGYFIFQMVRAFRKYTR